MPLLKSARALRSTMTDAEQLLWYCLRRKQLSGFRFRRQHPVERFVLDFYCYETRLAIEIDGGQHNEPNAKYRDMARTEFLSCRGIQVLRFWNNDVFNNLEAVLQRIYEVLMERAGEQAPAEPPPSQPPPAGGRS
nr:endonuclease domain-containing protein [Pelotalea chapellei]